MSPCLYLIWVHVSCYRFVVFLFPGDDCSKSRPKVSIKFFLHSSGNIAAKFPYNDVLILPYLLTFFQYILNKSSRVISFFSFRHLWQQYARFQKQIGMEEKGFLFLSNVCISLYFVDFSPNFTNCSCQYRLWLFPPSSLSNAEKVIGDLTCLNIEVIKLSLL